MIYDVLADFNAGDIKYDKDTTDPRVPIESLTKFYDNKIKIETTKIKDIEKALSEYATMTDDILGIEVHNEDQYKRLKDERVKQGISDDIFPSDIKDLSNTAKLTMAKSKLKRYIDSPGVKMILEEQKKGNDYRAKANEIMSMNEPLGILAMKDYLEKYGNRTEKSYNGFDLNINDYVPMDVDGEIAKLAESIEREYRLVKDPNSPTGDGYLFVNKVSGVTDNGREMFERKINALKSNKRFDNNMKSYIAMNSPETDYNDQNTYNEFITEMMETHLGDKVVSTDVKKIDAKVVLGDAGGTGSGSSSSGGTSSAYYDSLKTQGERNAYKTRLYLEGRPDLKDYDFSGIEIMIPDGVSFKDVRDEMKNVAGSAKKEATGRKVAVFVNKDGTEIEIPLSKVEQGKHRNTLIGEQQAAASTKTSTPAQQAAQAEDVSINNPIRANAVAGLKSGEGRYLPDGTWVQQTKTGKIPMVKDAVLLTDLGLIVKDTPTQRANTYHLTRSTANKTQVFAAGIGDYMINEAGNDSVGHKNKKHYDGTAFDLALRGPDANNVDRLFETMLKAREAGLDPQYESRDKKTVDALNEKISVWNTRNTSNKFSKALAGPWSPHFSIYDNNPINVVKSGEIPALDNANKNSNSDYYDFVQKNNLKKRSAQEVVELNADYLKTKYPTVYNQLKESDDEVPSFGNVQTAMSIVSQSPTMANYMNNNKDEVKDIMNFVRNGGVQDQYMQQTLNNKYYPIMAEISDNNKFNKQEQLILLHVMGTTGGKEAIQGKRPLLTGYEMLEKHGFIKDGVRNLDKNKFNNLVKRLNDPSGKSNLQKSIDQGQVSLLKLAMKELTNQVPDGLTDIEYIVLNESEDKGYNAANPDSTAIGKYQFIWSDHKNEIKKLLTSYEPSELEVQNIDVPLPIQSDSIAGSNNNARFGI
jgi:hypothetical protein